LPEPAAVKIPLEKTFLVVVSCNTRRGWTLGIWCKSIELIQSLMYRADTLKRKGRCGETSCETSGIAVEQVQCLQGQLMRQQSSYASSLMLSWSWKGLHFCDWTTVIKQCRSLSFTACMRFSSSDLVPQLCLGTF
jgi:hypothetical protein